MWIDYEWSICHTFSMIFSLRIHVCVNNIAIWELREDL